MSPDTPNLTKALNKLRVRWAYWRQYVWFYAWKWSMPWSSLHKMTIRPVNMAREDYLIAYKRWWPKESPGCVFRARIK